ncbi:MAG: 2Fe-2S iron-sulfur cluster binding domain-containing protein [Gammaproteobacteria bacterium]|nr:2Fe-2S iron-sulfur cluster binding domain-containing protein [Gammaproteobacteria bacterium]
MTSEASSADNVTSFRATLDGVEHLVAYQAGEVLLDCMLAEGLDPAFQCMDGHCGSCMVVRISGHVEMRKNNVLSQHDLDRHYVLLCQSVPLTGDVLVDCDA